MANWNIPGGDWSFNPPNIKEFAADGNKWAARYVLGPTTSGKILTLSEKNVLHSYGIAILLLFESAPTRALQGLAAGQEDALAFEKQLTSVLSGNHLGVAVPAIDFDASPAQLAGPIHQYMLGWNRVHGLANCWAYGGGRTLTYLFDNKLISGGYDTTAAKDWGSIEPRANVRQEHNALLKYGGEVDLGHADSLSAMWQSPIISKPTSFHYIEVTASGRNSTLSGIALTAYDSAGQYPRIFDANRKGAIRADGTPGMIVNSNVVEPGWRLLIP